MSRNLSFNRRALNLDGGRVNLDAGMLRFQWRDANGGTILVTEYATLELPAIVVVVVVAQFIVVWKRRNEQKQKFIF